MIRDLWRHVEYNYAEGGIRQVLGKVPWRIRQELWSEESWLIYRIDLADYSREPVLPLRHCLLDFEALRRHGYFRAFAFPEAIQARLRSGVECNGFFLDGGLANIGWTSKRCLDMDRGVRIDDEDSFGIFDCHTFPQYRSKGVYTDTLVRMALDAKAAGAKYVLIAVDPGNVASIKGIERAGFQPLYQLTRMRRCGRNVRLEAPFKPRFPELALPDRTGHES